MDKISYFNKEYNYIKDDRLKENIKKIVDLLPDYFFTVPASSTGKYHPKFASSENGLLKHSKVACKIGYELMNNNSLGHKFTDKEKDLLIMSIMVHDGLKKGINEEKYTRFDHPILMANYIEDNKDKLTLEDEEIKFMKDVISSHMGEWNTSPYSDVILPLPKTKYQRFVHMCDFLSSKKFIDTEFDGIDIKE